MQKISLRVFCKLPRDETMVLVIVSVHDNCCSRLLIDWTLWEADSKWKVEEFFHKVFVGLFESDLLYMFNTVFKII